MTGVVKDEFLAKEKSICEKAASNKEPIEFEALANELMPKLPDKLVEVLTDSDLKLNDDFVPDRRSLGALVKFRARTKLWSVEFEREALSGGKILYDAKAKTLTFTDLPPDLTAALTAARTGRTNTASTAPITGAAQVINRRSPTKTPRATITKRDIVKFPLRWRVAKFRCCRIRGRCVDRRSPQNVFDVRHYASALLIPQRGLVHPFMTLQNKRGLSP